MILSTDNFETLKNTVIDMDTCVGGSKKYNENYEGQSVCFTELGSQKYGEWCRINKNGEVIHTNTSSMEGCELLSVVDDYQLFMVDGKDGNQLLTVIDPLGVKSILKKSSIKVDGSDSFRAQLFPGGFVIITKSEVNDDDIAESGKNIITDFIHIPSAKKLNKNILQGVHFTGKQNTFIITESDCETFGVFGKSKVVTFDGLTGEIIDSLSKINGKEIIMPYQYETYGKSGITFLHGNDGQISIYSVLNKVEKLDLSVFNFNTDNERRFDFEPIGNGNFLKASIYVKGDGDDYLEKLTNGKFQSFLFNSDGDLIAESITKTSINNTDNGGMTLSKSGRKIDNLDIKDLQGDNINGKFCLIPTKRGKLKLIRSEGKIIDISNLLETYYGGEFPSKKAGVRSFKYLIDQGYIIPEFANEEILILKISSPFQHKTKDGFFIFSKNLEYLGDFRQILNSLKVGVSSSSCTNISIYQIDNYKAAINFDGMLALGEIGNAFKEIHFTGNEFLGIDGEQYFSKEFSEVLKHYKNSINQELKESMEGLPSMQTLKKNSFKIEGIDGDEILMQGKKFKRKLLFR